MDIIVSNAYLRFMISRIVTLLAILAITVVTTVSSAHAARMGMGADHTAHAVAMMPSPDAAQLACGTEQPCGSTDGEMCDFVCMGLSAFLTSPGGYAEHDHGSAQHDVPSDAIHVSRAPGLNERPPKIVLL